MSLDLTFYRVAIDSVICNFATLAVTLSTGLVSANVLCENLSYFSLFIN